MLFINVGIDATLVCCKTFIIITKFEVMMCLAVNLMGFSSFSYVLTGKSSWYWPAEPDIWALESSCLRRAVLVF